MHERVIALGLGVLMLGGGGTAIGFAFAQQPPKPSAIAKDDQDKPAAGEQERSITEAEIPRAALTALRKAAGDAAFTEFAEELEHGHTFYEGSWKGPDGNVDALVTAAGDLVEIEEMIPFDKAPATARAAAETEAGKETQLTWEKKTLILYEIHFQKDGKGHEIMLTPDGRRYHEEGDDELDEDEEDQ